MAPIAAPTTAVPVTPVAVLGTLAEFQSQPIPYDLDALVRLVTDLRPDLLCLDLTPDQWQRQEFGGLPPEYAAALLPLAYQTDIVVVPIAGARQPTEPAVGGWRAPAIAALRAGLGWLQRRQPGPAAVNAGIGHLFADLLYEGITVLGGRQARQSWRAHTAHLAREVRDVARRDPSRRVLVVVNVRHCHHLRRALRRYPETRVVPYRQL